MVSALRMIERKANRLWPRAPWSSRLLVAGALGAVLLAAAACGSSGATSPTSTTGGNGSGTVKTVALRVGSSQHGSLGTILIDQSGMTLYRYSPDGTGKPTCTGACAVVWPPLIVQASSTHVVGTTGVATSELGTVARPGGMLQVTFEGMPLYRFSGDTKSGDTNGQGVDGIWFVIPTTSISPAPTSPPVTAPPSTPTPVPTPTVSTPSPTSPPVTAPPVTLPPATSPPPTPTSPPTTSPPATAPPPTQPSGGGYGY